MKEENCPAASQQEKYFLNTFPLIKQIILSKSGIIPSRFIDDLIQQVRFKLWKWKEKNNHNQDLSFNDWQKLANVVTKNEITDYCRRKENRNVLFSEIAEDENFGSDFRDPYSLEGNSHYELTTFLLLLWQKFQQLSLRQKHAFIFKKDDFLELLLKFGCCSPKDIANSLALSETEFVVLLGKLPLSDTDIQNLLTNKIGENLTIEQLWVARSKAKRTLLKSLKG